MKRIALLATGGTIASRPTARGLAPALSAAEIAAFLPARDDVRLVPSDVLSLDSSNIQPEEWSEIAAAADAALRDCDGVVVTHGTDTMAYTAAALSFMLRGLRKPVILTGSQLPMEHPLSDAPGNLARAVAACETDAAGVFVAFDRKLISGVRAVKTHTTSMDAFASVNAPVAGFFDAEGAHISPSFTCEAAEKRGVPYAFRPQIDPRVLLVKLVPGTSPDLLDFARTAGYRGVVLEAFGLGGLHYIRRNLVDRLAALADAGVLVLVVSQCLYEKADLSVYEVGFGLRRDRILSGRDMTTEAAVAKMMWALAQDDPTRWLAARLAGETR